ncbi:hypothetical protein ABZT04_29775 [Streptomyces sp. NPDC005492]|uniref:hypothetical protein n=1 Tax=Streptomyces sp. NPDC005492 TaxID=3156883 RepID=UPI0033A6E297
MNSAPQVQTLEISDAELDTVSGGLSPQIGLTAGDTSITSADVLTQVASVKDLALGTVAQLPQVSVTVGI